MNLDERYVYLPNRWEVSRPGPDADRVTAYPTAEDTPGWFADGVRLKGVLMDLRPPVLERCSWWRLDDLYRFGPAGIEFLDIREGEDGFGRVTQRDIRSFVHFGNEWVRLAQDDTGAVFHCSFADRWVSVFCEGPMSDGWVLEESKVAV